MKLIIILILFVILLRWISGLLMPLFRITSSNNDRLRQMQDKIREMEQQANGRKNKKAPRKGDYIDYEDLSDGKRRR